MSGELVQRLREAAREAFEGEPVVFAYLFGSRAHGRPRPDSDTDVAVLLDYTLDPDQRFAFTLRAFRPLEQAARTPIDLVVLNDAPLALQGRIVHDRVVLYSRDESLRVRYESLTLRKFWDFTPRVEAMARAYLADAARGDH